MRECKGGAAIAHLDAGSEESFSGLCILALAAAARRIEHHAHVDPAMVGCDDRLE